MIVGGGLRTESAGGIGVLAMRGAVACDAVGALYVAVAFADAIPLELALGQQAAGVILLAPLVVAFPSLGRLGAVANGAAVALAALSTFLSSHSPLPDVPGALPRHRADTRTVARAGWASGRR